jgi:hypothetical protein
MVPENTEAVFPYIHKIVLVNVSLAERGADAGAAGNGAVYADRGNAEARLTGEKMVPDLPFVWSQKAFAAVFTRAIVMAFSLKSVCILFELGDIICRVCKYMKIRMNRT